jgi:hypothetical protein
MRRRGTYRYTNRSRVAGRFLASPVVFSRRRSFSRVAGRFITLRFIPLALLRSGSRAG